MKKLKQYDIQMLVKIAVWKLLMAFYVVLVLMQSRWTILIVRDLGDMLCLKYRGKILVENDHRRNDATEVV